MKVLRRFYHNFWIFFIPNFALATQQSIDKGDIQVSQNSWITLKFEDRVFAVSNDRMSRARYEVEVINTQAGARVMLRAKPGAQSGQLNVKFEDKALPAVRFKLIPVKGDAKDYSYPSLFKSQPNLTVKQHPIAFGTASKNEESKIDKAKPSKPNTRLLYTIGSQDQAVSVMITEIVERQGYWYCKLVLTNKTPLKISISSHSFSTYQHIFSLSQKVQESTVEAKHFPYLVADPKQTCQGEFVLPVQSTDGGLKVHLWYCPQNDSKAVEISFHIPIQII